MLKFVKNFLEKYLTAFENFVITAIFWVLVVFNFVNVVTRKLFPQFGMAFLEDLSMLMFLWLVFFAAAQCYPSKSHLGLPFVFDMLKPRARMVVFTITGIVSVFFYVIVIRYTFDLFLNQLNMEVKTSMGFPAWIGGAALCFGSVFVLIRMLEDYVKRMREFSREAKGLDNSEEVQ